MATKDRVTRQNTNSQQERQNSGASNNLDLLPDAIYWPFKRLPQSKLLAYADACVQVVLKYSEAAERLYSAIVEAWGLPSCQPLISEARRHLPETRAWFEKVRRAIERNQVVPDYPTARQDAIAKLDLEHNHDYRRLLQGIGWFIFIGFNRKADQENLKPKVHPEHSPYLFRVVHARSLCEFALRRKQRGRESGDTATNAENPYHQLGGQLFDFAVLMGTEHTTRRERRLKSKIVWALRRDDFTPHHYSKLLDDAEKWYKSRVNPGTIEDYVSELARQGIYVDRSNIETAIAPCDEATGYPRKWRK